MQGATSSWWGWIVVIAALVGVAVFVLSRRSASRSKLQHEEQLAKRADAQHEGAQTRHEGGP